MPSPWPTLAAAPEAAAPLFEEHVRPILKAHCFHCHGEADKLAGRLDLRLRRLIEKGGKSGPAVVPGDPDGSRLLERVRRGEMPPGEERRKLSLDEIAVIARWIAAGAKTRYSEPETVGDGMLITEADRAFWAFQPVRRPAVPRVAQPRLARTPIDAFLLARLEPVGLSFSHDADRRALVRRAFLDLLGLPPSPDDVEAFRSDHSPGAWERLVDRLLASPHYGERWGRHWLDVAGYADSEGYTNDDVVRKYAYKYRDYVIASFNGDKPFDRFVREQLAGDEIVSRPYDELTPEDVEKLVATGFLRMAPDGTGSDGTVGARHEVVAETIKIVTSSLLGLTVGCARCHHHRHDPIPQEDYYRLRAVFEPAFDCDQWRKPQERLVSLYTDAEREAARRVEDEAKKTEAERSKKEAEFIRATLEKQFAKVPEELRQAVRTARDTPVKERTPEHEKLLRAHPNVNVTSGSLYLYDRKAAKELKALAKTAADIRSKKPVEEFVRALTEVPGRLPPTHVFRRGDHEQPTSEVAPGDLTILADFSGSSSRRSKRPASDPKRPTSGRRLAYARQLTDGTHPLTARVIVNRVWHHYFGRGIVDTPGDFGSLGGRPSHPLLLDWLAHELVTSGWKIKRLHRLILTSTVYRQAGWKGAAAEGLESMDDDNRLLSGRPLRRLEAETVRDAMLAVSGELNWKRLGPPVPVMADRVGQFVVGVENLDAGRPGAVIPMAGEEYRRSVYVQTRRSRPLTVLETFDVPRMEPNCSRRSSSTVAPQALFFMNSAFVVARSEAMARRLREEAGDDSGAQIERAWLLVFARQPTSDEVDDAVAFLDEQARGFEGKRESSETENNAEPTFQALASFCQTLLSSSEFLYVD